jgi:hypothetical protein
MKLKMKIAVVWIVALAFFSGAMILAEWAGELDRKTCEDRGMILVANGKGPNYCTFGEEL